ncbi:YqaE/Pmp3 family membrane protein [Fortiea sp. LEGE XX443]|uniref:YqaE/Pmp3 family membrane protein n=1 Tax=Fortiea sp. LEGE XX443 TaxID=1828611 RepID=UPI00187EF1E4|nr:YqaE/Pmp3 family membrane protein [Fortiea sp. LEGE XX443]MBE9005544.1 YqaE/Pmp3 family membrane protein [Fortiea sp. LEGE XX443]
MKLFRLLLALLLPPLGVFLTVGVGPTLVINILLTLLGWLPGSIHAVWVVAKKEEAFNSGTY